jgi:hypothetical protein
MADRAQLDRWMAAAGLVAGGVTGRVVAGRTADV